MMLGWNEAYVALLSYRCFHAGDSDTTRSLGKSGGDRMCSVCTFISLPGLIWTTEPHERLADGREEMNDATMNAEGQAIKDEPIMSEE
jgi:hypothetical protein